MRQNVMMKPMVRVHGEFHGIWDEGNSLLVENSIEKCVEGDRRVLVEGTESVDVEVLKGMIGAAFG